MHCTQIATARALLLATLLLGAAAHATEREHIPKPVPQLPPAPNVTTSATQSQAQQQTQGNTQSMSPTYDGGNSFAFVNIPTFATPLRAGLCPKGDSESFSVLWGLFSHAKSTTRSEMECLQLVLAARPAEPRLPPVAAECLHPPAKPAAPAKAKPARVAVAADDRCKR
jgi:hypothetical protein